MKKRILAITLVLSLLLVFSSSAFAASFDGKCTNYFFTTGTVTKTVANQNYAYVIPSSAEIYSSGEDVGYTARLYAGSTEASNVMYFEAGDSGSGDKDTGHLVTAYRDNDGLNVVFKLKVDNTYNRGTKIHVVGSFGLQTDS